MELVIFGKKIKVDRDNIKYKDDDGFLTEMKREEKIFKELGIESNNPGNTNVTNQKNNQDAIATVTNTNSINNNSGNTGTSNILETQDVSKAEELEIEQNTMSAIHSESSENKFEKPKWAARDSLKGLFNRIRKNPEKQSISEKETKNKEIKNQINNSTNVNQNANINQDSNVNKNSNINQINTEPISTQISKQLDEEVKQIKNDAQKIADKNKRRIYALNGLPPEVIAVAFAKCSRSPEPFDEIAKELNEDLTRKFHERWIVGYGHGSVAEHAILSIAIENVSILATKVLEDNRLASYTEKSTRYQVFDKNRYYKPAKIMSSKHAQLYEKTFDSLIDIYSEIYPKMLAFVKQKYPRADDVDEKLYEVRMKAKALDNARYILPVGVLTNLGMTINARQLEYAITKLMSHPLDEMKDIGAEIKETAVKVTPTLVKYAEYNEYIAKTPKELSVYSHEKLKLLRPDDSERVVLVEYDREAEDKVVAAILYRNSDFSYKQIRDRIRMMKREEKQQIIDLSVSGMSKHDRPPREFEHINFTFDVLMDYGAFRDIQRHRICTQTNQEFNTNHGYSLPAEIVEAKLEKEFIEAMKKAKVAYDAIAQDFPYEATYIVPMAYKKRVLITMNLREACHFIKLRSGKTGHISYRRLAQQMWDAINEKQQLIARYIEVDKS